MPAIWGDLWTLELQLYDAPGQYFRLVNLLDKLEITIIASESHQTYRERYFAMFLALDCLRYYSDIDGKSNFRVSNPRSDLDGLTAVILSHFIADIRLSGFDQPRLSIHRNWPHYDLHNDIENESLSKKVALPLNINKDGWFNIDDELAEALSMHEAWRVYVSANTRSRLIYLNLAANDDKNTMSLIFYFDRQDNSLNIILDVLSENNYNILRHQLRPFLLGPRQSNITFPDFHQPYTLNTLVEARDAGAMDVHEHQEAIQRMIDNAVGSPRVCVLALAPRDRPFVREE